MVAATGGRLIAGGDPGGGGFSEIATDSRTVGRGGLFVPIVAERDGHDFIADAVAAGATGSLVEAGRGAPGAAGISVVEVPDTAAALLDLGRAARRRVRGPVTGITGSVGKTSTKDLLAAALATCMRVVASEKSFNNELGVPLTLANAPDDSQAAVVEMGARGVGHIALLCSVARPTIGVVTAVAAVHTECFGSLEAVAEAKGELVEALPPDGTAVLNGDDPRVSAMAARSGAPVLRYSAAGAAGSDVAAAGVTLGADLRPSFVVHSPWGSAEVQLAARGAHQVGNALAAVAVASVCGVPIEETAAALGRQAVSPWRMELGRSTDGTLVLNDAYNANPASVAAALRALAALDASRRVAVLGPMAELGDESAAAHSEAASLASRLGLELLAVGTDAYGVTDEVDDLDGAEAWLRRRGASGDGVAVLVKGSRVAGLERLARRLLEG